MNGHRDVHDSQLLASRLPDPDASRATLEADLAPPAAESWGWLMTTNHKDIGLRYIVTAFCFFLAAGVLALLMRIQLAVPNNHFIGPDLYNQFFTVHGTTMMFLFAVPVMEGIGAVPRAADGGHAQRRLPAAERIRLLHLSVRRLAALGRAAARNTGPDAGWFAYVPLVGPAVFARASAWTSGRRWSR